MLNLDDLGRPPLQVVLNGSTYNLAPNNLETGAEFGELQKGVKDAAAKDDPKAMNVAMKALLRFIAPEPIPEALIARLGNEQQVALIRAWASQAIEAAEQDEAEAAAVVKDPTSPG